MSTAEVCCVVYTKIGGAGNGVLGIPTGRDVVAGTTTAITADGLIDVKLGMNLPIT